MKADPHDTPLQLDENDPVWRLLAEAPRPEPDAWFAVRTLARCRSERLRAESGAMPLVRMWRWALGGGLGLCLAVVLVVAQIHSESMSPDKQKNVQEAFEIMASVDPDSDSSSWQDSSL